MINATNWSESKLMSKGEKTNLSLADIIAGTDISWLPHLGIDFSKYSNLKNWFQRLMQRLHGKKQK